MNAGELRRALEDFPDDVDILIASDDEGNGYRNLYYYPEIFWIEANADKRGWVDSVYSVNDLPELGDEPVEARLVIG